MSGTLAHYAFIPWVREGISTRIAELDALGNPTNDLAKERAELGVELNLESIDIDDGSVIQSKVNKKLKVLGPPDVLGISADAVVRMEPKPKVNNYEANGLPYIEFYQEDFPWAYSPSASNNTRITPWLALICLKDDEFEVKHNADGRKYIAINGDKIEGVFHDEKQHWAWAHVQMTTELEANSLSGQIQEVIGELDANPDTGVSRVICPRKLIKETQYTAFVIPAFETGRLAGLGADFAGVLAQKMSWGGVKADYEARPRGLEYPVYFDWTFRTGKHGDFESLARILKAVVTDPELGKRDMYIEDAGYGLKDQNPDSKVLGIEGALKPPGFTSDPWTNGSNDVKYREHLRKLLNLSIDHGNRATNLAAVSSDSLTQNPFYSSTLGDDPIVTPHVYGRWHGLVLRLRPTGTDNHPWVNDLNLNPANRSAAGLGVTVIQKNQEKLMQRAWKQVEEINEANDKIRKASVSKLVNQALFKKHILSASEDQTIKMSGPMHRYMLDKKDDDNGPDAGGTTNTLEYLISQSKIPNASKSGAFKKITRPGKKSNKLILKSTNALNALDKNIIQRFNATDASEVVTAAKTKTAPPLAVNLTAIGQVINDSLTNFQASDTAMAQQALFETLLQETSFNTLNKNDLKTKINNYPGLSAQATTLARDLIDGIQSSTEGDAFTSHQIIVDKAPFQAVFGTELTAKSYDNIVISHPTEGAAGQLGRATLKQDIELFQTAFVSFDTQIVGSLMSLPQKPQLTNLAQFSNQITRSLYPKHKIQSRVLSQISMHVLDIASGAYIKREIDKLRPIMAHPVFDDPMFRDLKAISQDYILPNLEKVPQNSITLLETNRKFIEAYMAGLNHEMSRELLWREFPCDQRGTYFRQFWDISDNIQQQNKEMLYDIQKMHLWGDSLGEHSPRPNDDGYLVLLIRGELLKKYPNTQVYAQKAKFKNTNAPDAPRALADPSVADNLKVPVFMAELDPDIYLFGFDLDIDEAKGDSSDATKPGWFFCLRERPGQIRFGLDDWTPANPAEPAFPTSDPANWNDLSWEHLVNAPEDLQQYHVDALHAFTAGTGADNSPLAVWGKNSADMAYILYQNPVLFARHAQEMLPD